MNVYKRLNYSTHVLRSVSMFVLQRLYFGLLPFMFLQLHELPSYGHCISQDQFWEVQSQKVRVWWGGLPSPSYLCHSQEVAVTFRSRWLQATGCRNNRFSFPLRRLPLAPYKTFHCITFTKPWSIWPFLAGRLGNVIQLVHSCPK